MNEARRQQYLDVIGIDSYMPRLILPFAPVSKQCQPAVDEPPLAVIAQGVTPDSELAVAETVTGPNDNADYVAQAKSAEQINTVSKVASPLDVLHSVSESAGERLKDTTEADVTPAAKAQDVSFALSVWRVSDDLLIIDSRQAELAYPVNTLLINILSALGFAKARLPKTEVLAWPKVDSYFSGQDAQSARDMLGAMFAARLELKPAKFMLLLGGPAAHYVLPQELLVQDDCPRASLARLQGKSVFVESMQTNAIVVPSLVDILQDPSLKASVWRAVQPLRLQ